MSDLGLPIPPLNKQIQENYMIAFDLEKNPHKDETGPKTTPLRWLLSNLEKQILIHAIAEDIAENTSNFEPFCPVCLEDYITPSEETIPGSGKASQLNEKPLKLHCGHVIGHSCFSKIMKPTEEVHKCPLCRCHIYPIHKNPPLLHSKIPFIDRKRQWSISGGFCCAIRLFICINSTKPETLEALKEWVHSQLLEDLILEEQTDEEVLYILIMRWAVDGFYDEITAVRAIAQ